MVGVYKGRSSMPALDALDRLQEGMVKKHPKISTLSIIPQVGEMMHVEAGVRDRSLALNEKYEPYLRGSAIVITARGLGAVMVRSFFSGFFLLTKSWAQMKTYSTIGDGLSFVQGLPDQDPSIKALKLEDIEAFVNAPAK